MNGVGNEKSPRIFVGGNGACHRICPETAQDKSNRPFATSQYPHGASERRYGLGNARKAARARLSSLLRNRARACYRVAVRRDQLRQAADRDERPAHL